MQSSKVPVSSSPPVLLETQPDAVRVGSPPASKALVLLAALSLCAAVGFGVAWGVAFKAHGAAACPSSSPALTALSVRVTSGGSSAFPISSSSSLPLELKFAGAGGAVIPPSAFQESHASLLHVIALGADFSAFAHVHPEEVPGYAVASSPPAESFAVLAPLNASGMYLLGLDGQLVGGGPVSKRSWITAVGGAAALAQPASWPAESKLTTKVRPAGSFSAGRPLGLLNLSALNTNASAPSGGYLTVELTGLPSRILAGASYGVAFSALDESSMPGMAMPVTDMTPFYGAAAHLAVVREGLSAFEHLHCESAAPIMVAAAAGAHSGGHRRLQVGSTAAFGPSLYTNLVFDTEGWYMLILQFVSNNKFYPATFKVLVE